MEIFSFYPQHQAGDDIYASDDLKKHVKKVIDTINTAVNMLD